MFRRLSQTLSVLAVALSIVGCTQDSKISASRPINDTVKVYELNDLEYRTGDHSTPDALVYIAPGYVQGKPIHLIVYNHGMMNNLNEVAEIWQLKKHMSLAVPNTVMVVPEWAERPEELSLAAGDFHKPGFFKNMLFEIFSKTPALKNVTLNDIKDISIVSYSGGWQATATELYSNGLEPKIVSVSMLDSLYKGNVLDRWIQNNLKALATGEKQYHNFFFHTWPQSHQQLKRINKMLANAGIAKPSIVRDLNDGNAVMKPEKIARYGIVFKQSNIYDEKYSGHMATANVYFPRVVQARKLRETKDATQLASTAKERAL